MSKNFFEQKRAAHGDVKVALLKRYLQGWFGKLGQNPHAKYKFLIVTDPFAGCGTYGDGAKGSPLVAIDTFIEAFGNNPQMFKKVEVVYFLFAEPTKAKFKKLEVALAAYKSHSLFDQRSSSRSRSSSGNGNSSSSSGSGNSGTPEATKFTFKTFQCKFQNPDHPIASFLADNPKIPSISFIDPYGFKMIPMTQVQKFMSGEKAEIFLNFNMGGLPRTIGKSANCASSRTTLNALFGGDSWQGEYKSPREQRRALVDAYRSQLSPKTIAFAMRNPKNHYVYYLVYATKNDKELSL